MLVTATLVIVHQQNRQHSLQQVIPKQTSWVLVLHVNRVPGNREERQNGHERQCLTEDVLSDQISAASRTGKEGGKRKKNSRRHSAYMSRKVQGAFPFHSLGELWTVRFVRSWHYRTCTRHPLPQRANSAPGIERQCLTEDILSDQISAVSKTRQEGGKRQKKPQTVGGTLHVHFHFTY